MKAVLGLGGNIGDSLGNLRAALNAVANLCGTRLLRVSRYYLTEAVEVAEPQPPYINCVAEIETALSPNALLGACFGIESSLGRTRPGYKSPRTVDIDLLLYEGVSLCATSEGAVGALVLEARVVFLVEDEAHIAAVWDVRRDPQALVQLVVDNQK